MAMGPMRTAAANAALVLLVLLAARPDSTSAQIDYVYDEVRNRCNLV